MKFWLTTFLLGINAAAFCTSPHAYVTELGGDSISIIDVNRNTVQKIFGFSKPHVVRVSFDGSYTYVGDTNKDIFKVDCMKHTVTRLANLSGHPISFCILPDASHLYILTSCNSLVVVDLSTEKVVAEIEGLSGPQDMRCTPDGKFVYVTNKKNGTISIFSTSDHTLYQTITGLETPVGIIFDINGKFAYVTDKSKNLVYVIRLSDNTVIDTVLGFNNPKYIVVAPKKTVGYVSNGGNDSISIFRISDHIIIGHISIPDPGAMGVSPDGQFLYVASGLNQVFKINTLDNSIEAVLSEFNNPSNISIIDNNVPPDTVNGWQVATDPKTPFNQVVWEKPAGGPTQYRIYRDRKYKNLLATILSDEKLIYNDKILQIGQTYSYYVIADYPNGFSSTIGDITITPNRVGLER